MRVELQQELDQLEATLQEEGDLVLRALRGALNALRERDGELADEVIAFDDEVDTRALEIERQVESVLARQTPVAGDLRLVLAILHVNLHLERMADLCVNIAKMAKVGRAIGPNVDVVVEGFEEMGSRAEEMTRIALESFRLRDLTLAESLVALDELIDRSNRRAVGELARLEGDAALREWALLMIVVSRCLERIGDNAVDIGEQTAYLVSGDFREFEDASHPS
ncbi:MAG: phosphate signaling complex protein PhoU [Thermoleophilia bacterium]|nr:phosphate signaling complex protein PhoU [Thermoleophilia bacterium]